MAHDGGVWRVAVPIFWTTIAIVYAVAIMPRTRPIWRVMSLSPRAVART